jgi:superfamily II RNA helicase
LCCVDGVANASVLQIDTADELMTTELMFNAVWKQLSTPQLVALLSCLVPCNEKDGGDEVRLPLELAGAVATLQEFAGNICAVANVRIPCSCASSVVLANASLNDPVSICV